MQKSLLVLSMLGAANIASAARGQEKCEPEPPAVCYPDDCRHCYCLGPENYGANAPVRPYTCNGDLFITVAGFYWNAHQDGMEYAIDNCVTPPNLQEDQTIDPAATQVLNNLVASTFKTPDFDWDFGFKVGVGYVTTCDSWDIGVLWTWYRGRANDHIEREREDNASLMPLWSGFASAAGSILFATDIETHWKLQLNLIDIELGREFWTSKYLTLRPFVGLRIAFIDQDFEIRHKGGSWSAFGSVPAQIAYNDQVDLRNDFKGVGIRAGLNTVWNVGCGWGIYGNLAGSIVYGRFYISHDEDIREATAPHDKISILDYDYSFRASRAMLDLGLGVQWHSMFCDCQYGFTFQIGYEQHLFFHQNQLWRVNRIGADLDDILNNTGENVFLQRRGTLDTQGWTLTLIFSF